MPRHTGDYNDAWQRDQEDRKRWIASGGVSPGVGAPSAAVIASKGKPPNYTIKFHDSCDPDVRAKIGAGIARIDARPHRDPVWKPVDYRALPTEAQRVAAAGRVLGYLVKDVPSVSASEECGERDDKGPHEPMSDGKCARCDRTVAAEVAEVTPATVKIGWRCYTCTRHGTGDAPMNCPECTSERDDNHGPHPLEVAEVVTPAKRIRKPRRKSIHAVIAEVTRDAPEVKISISTPFSGSSLGCGLPASMVPRTPTTITPAYTGPTLVPDPPAEVAPHAPRYGAGAYSMRNRRAA